MHRPLLSPNPAISAMQGFCPAMGWPKSLLGRTMMRTSRLLLHNGYQLGTEQDDFGPAKNHPWMLTTRGCPGTPDPRNSSADKIDHPCRLSQISPQPRDSSAQNFSAEEFLGSGVPGHPRVVSIQGWFLASPRRFHTLHSCWSWGWIRYAFPIGRALLMSAPPSVKTRPWWRSVRRNCCEISEETMFPWACCTLVV